MLKQIIVLIFSLSVCLLSFAEGVACKAPSPTESVALSVKLTYEVVGAGRLYFHTAPKDTCMDKKIFVIPGDSLTAYKESGQWSQVVFISKNGEPVNGWVLTERLKFLGASGMEMTPKELNLFSEAAKAAQAGKLGSPFEKR